MLTAFNFVVHNCTVVVQHVRLQRVLHAPQPSLPGTGASACQYMLHTKANAHPGEVITSRNKQLLRNEICYEHE